MHRHRQYGILRNIRRKCHERNTEAREVKVRVGAELWPCEPAIFTGDEVDYLVCGWAADFQSVMRHPALLDEGPMFVRNIELGALWALRSFLVHQRPEDLFWS